MGVSFGWACGVIGGMRWMGIDEGVWGYRWNEMDGDRRGRVGD